MNQEERRIYLIREMQREMPQYADIPIPEEEMQQRRLLRSLFNLRPPYPASEDFLNVQDAYLSEVIRERGIVEAADLPSVKASPRISLWQGDITSSITATITAIIGVIGLSGALQNWLLRSCTVPERILLLIGGLCLFYPGVITDIIGIACMGFVIICQYIRNKKDPLPTVGEECTLPED